MQLSFLERLLVFHPAQRITVGKALQHQWFRDQGYSNRNGTHAADASAPDVLSMCRYCRIAFVTFICVLCTLV
jgi:hypothetical protein